MKPADSIENRFDRFDLGKLYTKIGGVQRGFPAYLVMSAG